ncbi:MAG: cytochrome c3 family protein [Bryobacteraceae bacterium]
MLRATLLLVTLALLAASQVPAPKTARPAPEQPLPFSHKTHVANGLKCAECHTMPDPGDFATLPKTDTCMKCHVAIKKDSPHIAKLADFHTRKRPIPWAPVYRIPDWVMFSHIRHTAIEGVTCETCHGPVHQRDVLRREKDLSMAACMECHRVKGASLDCLYCHDQR